MTLRFSGNLTKTTSAGGGNATVGLVTSWDAVKAGSTITGVAPLGIVFDLSTTTDPSTTKPFRHLLYYHDFGEVSGETWAISGASKDTDYGPIVAHTYTSPGTYTYTVAVTDDAGLTTIETLTIVVQDPGVEFAGANTICYSSSGDWTGAPAGATLKTSSSWATIAADMTSGKRVLLRRGDTFTASSGTTARDATKTYVGAFGTGADPVINFPSLGLGSKAFRISRCVDFRVEGLEFIGSTANAAEGVALGRDGSPLCRRILIKDVTVRDTGVAFQAETIKGVYPAAMEWNEGVVWDTCKAINIGTQPNGYCYWGQGKRIVLNGCELEKKAVGINTGHNVRVGAVESFAVKHCKLDGASETRHCMKCFAWGLDSEYESRNVCMADNWIIGYDNWITAFAPQTNAKEELVTNILVERNFFDRHPSSVDASWITPDIYIYIDGTKATVRNNIVYGTIARMVQIEQRGGSPSPMPEDIEVINNTYYCATDTSVTLVSLVDSNGNMVIANNLVSGPLAASVTFVSTGLAYDASNNKWIEGDYGLTAAQVLATVPPSTRSHFRLLAGTPPIDAGDAARILWLDAEMRTRGSVPNIGAQENV